MTTMIFKFVFLLLVFILMEVEALEDLKSAFLLQFSMEYGLWRGWGQMVLYSSLSSLISLDMKIKFIKCASLNGMRTTIDPEHLEVVSKIDRRLGIVIVLDILRESNLNETLRLFLQHNKNQMITEPYEWLVITKSRADSLRIQRLFKEVPIRFDSNIVVGFPNSVRITRGSYNKSQLLCDRLRDKENNSRAQRYLGNTRGFQKHHCNSSVDICYSGRLSKLGYYKFNPEFSNLTKSKMIRHNAYDYTLQNSGLLIERNNSKFGVSDTSKLTFGKKGNVSGIDVVQYFKVRHNSTLYSRVMGTWTFLESMSHIEAVLSVESRNFQGEEFMVGRLNFSDEQMDDHLDRSSELNEQAEDLQMDDMVEYLTRYLNANTTIKSYPNLGVPSYDGTWSGLLGAVTTSSVDIGLEPINVEATRKASKMKFIFPVGKTMRNIYIKQQETSAVRDIFLAPFSPGLIASVLGVILLIAIMKVLINAAPQGRQQGNICESMMWCWAIMCQQGGAWEPRNAPARIVLISCLLFGLVIYNSYAAFITSILSVRVAAVDSVAAILQNEDIQIGYIKNGADQVYLMSTKDQDLNRFYIRGYTDPTNLVDNVYEGLNRVAKENYAFFGSQMAARSALQMFSQERGRCSINEVKVPSTKSDVSFAFPQTSPYVKPVLMSLLDLRGRGVLTRLRDKILPTMPQCSDNQGFAGAHTEDVKTALTALGVGGVLAIVFGVAEYVWIHKTRIISNLKNLFSYIFHHVIEQVHQ